VKEDWYRKAYGPSAAKTYETSLFNMITTEFGYIGGPDIVKLFTKKIVELNNQYYFREEFVRPGQMRWLVLKAGQKYSKSKKLSEMQLIPVTLTLINPEDIEDRVTKVKKKGNNSGSLESLNTFSGTREIIYKMNYFYLI